MRESGRRLRRDYVCGKKGEGWRNKQFGQRRVDLILKGALGWEMGCSPSHGTHVICSSGKLGSKPAPRGASSGSARLVGPLLPFAANDKAHRMPSVGYRFPSRRPQPASPCRPPSLPMLAVALRPA